MALVNVAPAFYGVSGLWTVTRAEKEFARTLLPSLGEDARPPTTPPGLLSRMQRCAAVLVVMRQAAIHAGPDLGSPRDEVRLWAMLDGLIQQLITLTDNANAMEREIAGLYGHLGVVEAWWELHRPQVVELLGQAETGIARLTNLLAEALADPA